MRIANAVFSFLILLQLVFLQTAFAGRAESDRDVDTAIESIRERSYWRAARESNEAIKEDKTNPRAWMWHGIACYLNGGKALLWEGCSNNAITPLLALGKAEELSGGQLSHPYGRAVLAYLRGKQYWNLGEYDKAMAQFNLAIQSQQNMKEAYFDLAKLQEEREQAAAAISTYRLWIQRYPETPEALVAKQNADRLAEIAAQQEAARQQAIEEEQQAELRRQEEARQGAQAQIEAERQAASGRRGVWIWSLLGVVAVGLVVWRRIYRPRQNAEVVDVMGDDGENVKVEIPNVFDEGRVRRDLAKYSKSETALKTYINGISTRFAMEQDRKVMLKLIEHLGLRKDLYAAALSAIRAHEDLGRANLESQVATLELELKKKRLLLERQKVDTLESKQMELEIVRIEQQIEGLKHPEPISPVEAKRMEAEIARLEHEIEELRRKPEPSPLPPPEELPEQYATRRADLLIKYAGEVKRIRESVDDPELASNLIDQFIVDIQKRDGR